MKPTVLLVDDYVDSTELYVLGLEMLGWKTGSATTADDAFTQACTTQPDVIVVDLGLPDRSGVDLIRQFRQDFRTLDSVIVVLTGHTNLGLRAEAATAGSDGLLLKPCTVDVLADAMTRALKSCRGG